MEKDILIKESNISSPKRDDDIIINKDYTVDTDNIKDLDFKNTKINYIQIFIWVWMICIIIILLIVLLNSKTIEDMRIKNLNSYKKAFIYNQMKSKEALNLYNVYKLKTEKLKICIEQNSIQWQIVDCNVFNK